MRVEDQLFRERDEFIVDAGMVDHGPHEIEVLAAGPDSREFALFGREFSRRNRRDARSGRMHVSNLFSIKRHKSIQVATRSLGRYYHRNAIGEFSEETAHAPRQSSLARSTADADCRRRLWRRSNEPAPRLERRRRLARLRPHLRRAAFQSAGEDQRPQCRPSGTRLVSGSGSRQPLHATDCSGRRALFFAGHEHRPCRRCPDRQTPLAL